MTLLEKPGAVPREQGDTVAWHYGDPLREQKTLLGPGAVVDRGDRDVLALSGPERLSWLHNLVTQHVADIQPGQGSELLVLSPHGHIEHHAGLYEDGEVTWLDTDPGQGVALVDYLLKMRFFAQVEINDVSADWALMTSTGPTELTAPDVLPVPGPQFAAGELAARATAVYSGVAAERGWSRRTDALSVPTVDTLVPRDALDSVVGERALAGSWAFDTARIPALRPVLGVDTDHKTIPHEVPALLAAAVHLDKGCYRGQETVARVHNLGKPPRRLAMLHLDGSEETAPAPGTELTAKERVVGRGGTASRHYEDGMIALALVKRNLTEKPETRFHLGDMAAGL